MKHQNNVLCVPAIHVGRAMGGALVHGVQGLNPAHALQYLQPHLVYLKRADVESDETIIQLIPYLLFARTETLPSGQVETSLSVYRRASSGGEERVAGKVSVGYGGHIEEEDCVQLADTDMINLFDTIGKCIQREVVEEVQLNIIDESKADGEMRVMTTNNVVMDLEEPVGRTHLPMLYLMMLPAGVDAQPKEEGVDDLGYMKLEDILEQYGDEIEGCSRLVIEALLKNQETYNNVILTVGHG